MPSKKSSYLSLSPPPSKVGNKIEKNFGLCKTPTAAYNQSFRLTTPSPLPSPSPPSSQSWYGPIKISCCLSFTSTVFINLKRFNFKLKKEPPLSAQPSPPHLPPSLPPIRTTNSFLSYIFIESQMQGDKWNEHI